VAVWHEKWEVVQVLLENGANPNIHGENVTKFITDYSDPDTSGENET
jgi:hypothetical protein